MENFSTNNNRSSLPGLMSRREKQILLWATWFRVGHLPYMPGTWGSLAAVPLWWLLQHLGLLGYGLLVMLFGVVSIYLSGRAEICLQQPDAPVIVIDEVVGQLIALAGCPVNFYAVGLNVVLFRLLDIFKPFPIGLINARLGGGLGIVLDDVVAGIYAGLSLYILIKWISP
jgi:phosphatidylglycerophosphatase A